MTQRVQNPLKGYVVTIDGPAGAGKGTLGKGVSYRYRIKYLDTGTLYRTVAHKVTQANGQFDDDSDALKALENFNYDFKHVGNNQFGVFLDGKEVTAEIRTMEAGVNAAKVARFPSVREALIDFQRKYVSDYKDLYGVLLDGQDSGTVICPEANFKFFLDAAPEVRAKRRHLELIERGHPDTYENILTGIQKRDDLDRNRPVAPLKPADDALIIDTSYIDAYTVLEKVIETIETEAGVTKSISA